LFLECGIPDPTESCSKLCSLHAFGSWTDAGPVSVTRVTDLEPRRDPKGLAEMPIASKMRVRNRASCRISK
jgi:hypothetical protein